MAVQQNPRVPEASNERPEVQQTLINTEGGSPLTAFARLDAAVPNLESSFLDLRDPMTAPDGTTPTKPQVHRLTAGFALGALLFTAPMAALNSVLIPQTISRLSGTDRVTDLALLSVVGTLLTFLMNAWISVGSDHSYCPLGRRTPWIIAGTVLTATSVAILSACDFMPLVIVFWLFTLIGHAMISMPLRPLSVSACLTSSVIVRTRGVALARRSARCWALSRPFRLRGPTTIPVGMAPRVSP